MILAFRATLSVKLPFMSVITPFVVPFSSTLAPMMPSPFTSVTVPVSWIFCAKELSGIRNAKSKASFHTLFMWQFLAILPMCVYFKVDTKMFFTLQIRKNFMNSYQEKHLYRIYKKKENTLL